MSVWNKLVSIVFLVPFFFTKDVIKELLLLPFRFITTIYVTVFNIVGFALAAIDAVAFILKREEE